MKIDLSGKTMLVTGGTSGIGKAIAQRALEAGAQVAIMSRAPRPSTVPMVRSLLA